jgi:hypothetical protein
MAKRTFPDKELSAKAIKALMDVRGLPPGPQQLDALKKAAQLRDAANSYHQFRPSAQGNRITPDPEFTTSVSEKEGVVVHVRHGHFFKFPIRSNGTVTLHGSHIDPNPSATREAGRFLFEAHTAARVAFARERTCAH